MSRRVACTLALAALVAGCPGELSQLVVVVDSDLDVPTALDGVTIVVRGPNAMDQTVDQPLGPGGEPLPITLGLTPSGDALGPVEVTAIGTLVGAEVVRQMRSTTLVSGETRVLYLFLSTSCVGVSCDEGLTCDDAACVDVVVPSSELPPWTGELPGDRCTDDASCDDGIDCTMDSCVENVCAHTPADGVCTAGAEGRCDVESGCQYASCTAATCVAGACETARCEGATCVRETACATGQECCAGACVPMGCDDGIACTVDACGADGCESVADDSACDDGDPCTDETCDAATGCVPMPNTESCDDGVFCNGADTCAGGNCATHAGDPCPGASVCDEGMSTCTGCAVAADCPAPIPGAWSSCSFGSTCAESGTRSRTVTSFTCRAGVCEPTMAPETGPCARSTTGISCAAPTYGAWSACTNTADPCATTGMQTRTVTTSTCGGGSCNAAMSIEGMACTRITDGDPCAAGGPMGACFGGTCQPLRTVTARTDGNREDAARFTVTCRSTGATCTVEGNRDGSCGTCAECSITCPQGDTVDLCCSNGSVPCGGTPASPGLDDIEDFGATGFPTDTCPSSIFGTVPSVMCDARVGGGTARATCWFGDG